jgi:PAS domain S-box-containing protein
MDIVIENAGAQQGCLILEKDERWVIEAQGTADLKGRVTLHAVEVEDSDTVCASIVRYAARSQETIVLDHAAREGLFVDDAYVKRNQTKSVLCMPLLNQGRLIGILYLENNLAANTFTPQRIEVLKLLAGQAAIALENARLYQQAQQEIAERKLAETAMRESEGAYRAFVENLPIGVYRISPDPNGSHLIANPAFLRMVGYESLEELVQKSTVADLYQDPTESRNFSDNLLAKGHVDRVEVYLKRSDGTPMWGAITASVGHSSSGDVYFDCIIEDITERKRTEAQIERALRETQTRFEISQALVGAETEEEVLDVLIQHASLYPQAFVAIFTFDRTGGELVATLRRQDTFESGFAAAMSIGEHLPASRYTLFNHFFADQPFVSENVEADERFEPAGRAALEQMGAVSFTALPLTVGNEWMGYIGVMAKPRGYFDEEKRHLYQTLAEQGSVALHAARLREMVRASQQRLALLVQQSPLAVMEWDIDHRVVSWNPAAERIFGYNAKEALGFHMMDLIVPPAARPLFDQTWQALLTQEDGGNTIHDNITKAGCTITCEWFNAPLINADGQAIGIASLVQDITERKQAETERETLITSLEAQNAELERFTYTVSHDLKAPLITIRGFLGYIEQDAVSGDIHRLKGDLQRISAATDKMQRLLNELLELSRIGRLMNPAQNIGFADLIQDAIKLLERQLREKHVEVRVQDDLPIVWGDPQRLLEVVQNLVDNAIKFMGGQTKPVIEIGTQGEEKGMPVLYVRDNGMGIAPQHHDRIFGLFNKLDANAEGTGVGLTIVKRIIEIHGGRIWVESEEGRGATFYFTLGKEIQSP